MRAVEHQAEITEHLIESEGMSFKLKTISNEESLENTQTMLKDEGFESSLKREVSQNHQIQIGFQIGQNLTVQRSGENSNGGPSMNESPGEPRSAQAEKKVIKQKVRHSVNLVASKYQGPSVADMTALLRREIET